MTNMSRTVAMAKTVKNLRLSSRSFVPIPLFDLLYFVIMYGFYVPAFTLICRGLASFAKAIGRENDGRKVSRVGFDSFCWQGIQSGGFANYPAAIIPATLLKFHAERKGTEGKRNRPFGNQSRGSANVIWKSIFSKKAFQKRR